MYSTWKREPRENGGEKTRKKEKTKISAGGGDVLWTNKSINKSVALHFDWLVAVVSKENEKDQKIKVEYNSLSVMISAERACYSRPPDIFIFIHRVLLYRL